MGGGRRGRLLLYRGALARLSRRLSLRLDESSTEGDCVRAVRQAGGPSDYFSALTAAWQQVAYADRLPAAPQARELCQGWRRQVDGGPAGRSA